MTYKTYRGCIMGLTITHVTNVWNVFILQTAHTPEELWWYSSGLRPSRRGAAPHWASKALGDWWGGYSCPLRWLGRRCNAFGIIMGGE